MTEPFTPLPRLVRHDILPLKLFTILNLRSISCPRDRISYEFYLIRTLHHSITEVIKTYLMVHLLLGITKSYWSQQKKKKTYELTSRIRCIT